MAIVGSVLRVREDIPGESGEYMIFQPLGWKALEEARESRTRKSTSSIKDMGSEIYRIVREATADSNTDTDTTITDPRLTHDHEILLNSSIVEWSYNEELCPSNIALLTEPTKKWALDIIIKICGLEEVSDDAMGKGSTLSIVS